MNNISRDEVIRNYIESISNTKGGITLEQEKYLNIVNSLNENTSEEDLVFMNSHEDEVINNFIQRYFVPREPVDDPRKEAEEKLKEELVSLGVISNKEIDTDDFNRLMLLDNDIDLIIQDSIDTYNQSSPKFRELVKTFRNQLEIIKEKMITNNFLNEKASKIDLFLYDKRSTITNKDKLNKKEKGEDVVIEPNDLIHQITLSNVLSNDMINILFGSIFTEYKIVIDIIDATSEENFITPNRVFKKFPDRDDATLSLKFYRVSPFMNTNDASEGLVRMFEYEFKFDLNNDSYEEQLKTIGNTLYKLFCAFKTLGEGFESKLVDHHVSALMSRSMIKHLNKLGFNSLDEYILSKQGELLKEEMKPSELPDVGDSDKQS